MPALVILSGPLEGQRIEVHGELTVGREAADLELDDPEVSRRHARLRTVGAGLEIEDLGSRNGTRLNGQRLTGPAELADGAVLRIGQTTARVELEARSAQTRAVASPQVTRESPSPEGGRPTVVRAGAGTPSLDAGQESGRTDVGARPAPRPSPRPAAPARASVPPSFGALKARPSGGRRGVASRLWVPMAATYAAIIGTAAGLIIYFADRA